MCLPLPEIAAGYLANFFVIFRGVPTAFGLLRVRPWWATLPVGCVVATWTIVCTGSAFGQAPPAWAWAWAWAWAVAMPAGAGLAAVALAVERGWARLAGLAAVAAVLLATLFVPSAIARQHEGAGQVREPGVPVATLDISSVV
jgi:Kef-type K+ transport system membrane component KefB